MHDRPPEHIRRLLREHAGRAYAEELNRELLPLADDFDRWRRGELDGFELSERIHRFHDGPARDLYKKYRYASPETNVAYAIHAGILERERVPPELLAYIGNALAFYAMEESAPAVLDEEELDDGDGEGARAAPPPRGAPSE
jgi:hypothetical protein